MQVKRCPHCGRFENPETKEWEYGRGKWYRHLEQKDIASHACPKCLNRSNAELGATLGRSV